MRYVHLVICLEIIYFIEEYARRGSLEVSHLKVWTPGYAFSVVKWKWIWCS